MKPAFFFLLLFCASGLFSCSGNKTEDNLDSEDRAFIEQLGILQKNETIELFETNGGWKGIKTAGSFITGDRIAYYWIEDGEKEIHSAFFHNEIDSITCTDLHTKLTYASCLTVYKTNGDNFKVYLDVDSTRLQTFYNKALDNWAKYRTNK